MKKYIWIKFSNGTIFSYTYEIKGNYLLLGSSSKYGGLMTLLHGSKIIVDDNILKSMNKRYTEVFISFDNGIKQKVFATFDENFIGMMDDEYYFDKKENITRTFNNNLIFIDTNLNEHDFEWDFSFNSNNNTLEFEVDFKEDIYDKSVRICIHKRIRNEQKFNGLESLIAQLKNDETTVRSYFNL